MRNLLRDGRSPAASNFLLAVRLAAPSIGSSSRTRRRRRCGGRRKRIGVSSMAFDLPAIEPQTEWVLLRTAVLENHLLSLLLASMRPLSNEKEDRIFTKGPLSRFAAKIAVAYGFGLIDDDLYDDLRVLREIRNKFAHTLNKITFSSPDVIELMQKFRGWRNTGVIDVFDFFKERVASCATQIDREYQQLLYDNAAHDDAARRTGSNLRT